MPQTRIKIFVGDDTNKLERRATRWFQKRARCKRLKSLTNISRNPLGGRDDTAGERKAMVVWFTEKPAR